MGTQSETAQQSFSCSADRVYAALIDVLGNEKMTIKFQDARQRQVFAGTGWSAFYGARRSLSRSMKTMRSIRMWLSNRNR